MMETKRLRPVWYGGPLRPRNTSKFKDDHSEDNLPKEKKATFRLLSLVGVVERGPCADEVDLRECVGRHGRDFV